jgi:hypothetical protein
MAYNNKYPEIKRTGGPYPRNRYGVCYEGLSRQQRRLLLENPLLKERAQDDQFLQILFEVSRYTNRTSKNKYYYDWSTGDFMKMEDLQENYDTIDWTCALSGEPIRSNINNFSPENFVHPSYHDTLGGNVVDARIVKSSIEFQQHIKKLLLNQQEEFLKLVRKNSKK